MSEDDKLFDHQDWKQIIINSTKHKKQPNQKVNVIKKKPLSAETKLNKLVENDKLKHPFFSEEFKQSFIKKRCEMKLTQKQMAQRLNVPHQKISEIESGKCLYNSQLNNKIKKMLKI